MHAAREPLVIGDPLQKLTELALFIDGKAREQGFLANCGSFVTVSCWCLPP